MINELLFLNENHTDTLIEQTKTESQETLEIKLNNQVQTFSFNLPRNLSEGKWLVTVASSEAMNSVYNFANQNNSFSITTPGHWSSRVGAEASHQLQKNLELRSENVIELHVKEFEKRGNQIKIEDKEHKLSGLDAQKRGKWWVKYV